MNQKIDSPQNKTIKNLVALRDKSRERKKQGLFLIEGFLEVKLALESNYEFKSILVCLDILDTHAFDQTIKPLLQNSVQIIEVSKEVYQKLAYRSTTEGVIAVAFAKDESIDALKLNTSNPLILVAEAPEKPGNIGALLRTADAANVDAFIIANPKTDLYNPNVIRSSVGGVFTNKIAQGTTTQIIQFLRKQKINIYTAILQSSISCYDQDFTQASAIVVGTEHDGLSEEWRQNATQNIIIPMSGKIDSMNVSVAAAIMIFEAKRQRGF